MGCKKLIGTVGKEGKVGFVIRLDLWTRADETGNGWCSLTLPIFLSFFFLLFCLSLQERKKRKKHDLGRGVWMKGIIGCKAS